MGIGPRCVAGLRNAVEKQNVSECIAEATGSKDRLRLQLPRSAFG